MDDERSARKAGQIVKAAERGAHLVNELLTFSRKRPSQAAVVTDINAALGDMRGMLRSLLREDIELILKLDPAAGSIQMDPGRFGQMVMNLAVNARDAISGPGAVTIATRNGGAVVPGDF